MRRARWALAVVVVLCLTASARADSLPAINGFVSGLELCQQSVCGAAVFVGIFQGRVGFNPQALGIVAVAVRHDPLPPPGFCALITGGRWEMRVGLRTFRGETTGSLCATLENTFLVTVAMAGQGGGTVNFNGLLDHRQFPPTIGGSMISQ